MRSALPILSAAVGALVIGGCAPAQHTVMQPATSQPTSQQSTAPSFPPPAPPRYSADQILNNEHPGRRESPPVKVDYDASGFARDRLYSVPPVGTHPRILFGPSDLPRIRRQLNETVSGRAMMQGLRDKLAKGIDKPGTMENRCFVALRDGDLAAFRAAYQTDWATRPPGSGPSPGLQKAAVSWSQRDPLTTALEMRCWMALFDDNAAMGKENAAAVTTYARYLQPALQQARRGLYGDDFWLGIRAALGPAPDFAFAYDWSEPYMTREQAAEVRSVISLATQGTFNDGMNLPPHWRNWNHIGMALADLTLALSIEGEDGYDPRIYDRGVEVARDYLTYSMTAQGTGKEGIGYHTAGLMHTEMFMLAAANRGVNLFTHTHFRNYFRDYLPWAVQPFGQGWLKPNAGVWLGEGDLASFMPNVAAVMPMKFFYPNDPQVNTVYATLPGMQDDKSIAASLKNNFVRETTLLCPADPARPPAATQPAHDPKSLDFYDAERGMMIARTGWNPRDMVMHFDCRCDTTFAAHDHADRGEFTLTALGVPWVTKGYRDTESQYHSIVGIDDHGQGYFPPPGRWVMHRANDNLTTATIDAKYCWDWMWAKALMVEPVAQLKAEHFDNYIDPRNRLLARFPIGLWERDPSPQVKAYYDGYLAGDPRMWAEDTWVPRAPHYPVQRAWRNLTLVRGRHPYAVIVDDIQKDNQEHLYQWRMMCPLEIDIDDIKGNDVTLKAKAYDGDPSPRLLVRGLNINQPALPTNQPNPSFETIELLKHDDTHQFAGRSNGLMHRLTLPSRSVAPDYKVLLAPYSAGQKPPSTEWNADHTAVTVDWGDQKDVVRFTPTPDRRTTVTVTRDGQALMEHE